MNKLIQNFLKKGKGIVIQIVEGFGVMMTDQGEFLYWDPAPRSNSVHTRMWKEHTENKRIVK